MAGIRVSSQSIRQVQGCAHCPLTGGEPNNPRQRGHWVQAVSWVPASTCVREKPKGNSFCRAPVDAGQHGKAQTAPGGTFVPPDG